MQEYQNILIALDVFGDYEAVLDRGMKVAGNPTEVSLVHVSMPEVFFEPYGMAFTAEVAGQVREQTTEKLMTIAKQHQISSDKVYVPVGNPADEIHALADEIDADLIVLGTHGRSGLKLLLGSTANAVLHGVKRDVLAVRV